MLKIKLARMGSKNHPAFRIVVAPDRSKLTGSATAILGYFLPLENKLEIKKDLYLSWLEKGAKPTPRVSKLMKSQAK